MVAWTGPPGTPGLQVKSDLMSWRGRLPVFD